MVDGLFDNLTCKPKLIIKHSNNTDFITLETKTDATLSPSVLSLEISKNLSLPCVLTPMTPEGIVGYIGGHEDGIWQPDKKKIPHGDNYIRFKDTEAETFGDLAIITLGVKPKARSLLTWGEGMIVKKDLAVGGFVSANQGLIALGSGVEGQFDPPGIWLFHSEENSLHGIKTLSSAPSGAVEGQLYINASNLHLYQRINSTWVDMGHKNDYDYNFDTVYIRKFPYKGKSLLPFEAPKRPIKNEYLGNLACKDIRAIGNLRLTETSGNSTTDANGTKIITFTAGTFPSGYAPVVVCTAFDPSGRSITAVVTAKTNTGFTVKTFLSNSGVHNHKVGDVRESVSNPLAINSAGSHSHNQINYSSSSQRGPDTGSNSSHVHTTTMYPAASTNSTGDHNHSMTKPTYVRDLAMRKQDGSTYVIGATMTQYNEPLTEIWTHDNAGSTTNTPVQAQFSWIAV